MERIQDIEKIKHLGIDPAAEMAINCEWVCAVSTDSDYGILIRKVGRIRFI